MRLHQFIEGTTGSGKSVTARNLALQCFYMGATVIVIEPHGDLVFNKKDGILSGIRERDLDRVALIDLSAGVGATNQFGGGGIRQGRRGGV